MDIQGFLQKMRGHKTMNNTFGNSVWIKFLEETEVKFNEISAWRYVRIYFGEEFFITIDLIFILILLILLFIMVIGKDG